MMHYQDQSYGTCFGSDVIFCRKTCFMKHKFILWITFVVDVYVISNKH